MLVIADAMIEASVARRESRGSHYRSDFPTRNDGDFLKTTVANYAAESGRVEIGYEPVMSELVTPRERNYSKTHAPAKAEATKTKATAAS